MKAFLAFGLVYSVLGQREVQYGLNGNCGFNYPECETYFDGCNECTCEVGDSSSIACTELACFVNETPFCEECEEDSYWLAFNTFQPPGTVSCSSRFLRSAVFLSDNSKCACPASNPYYERGVGCINEDGCDRLSDGKRVRGRDKFRFTVPNQNPKCPYEYKLCTSDDDCGYGLYCNIPEDNYKTCIPLSAKFDSNCNLVTGCNKCIDDCMGTGYGYCVDEVQCERGGCSNQGCFPVDEPGFTTCDIRCEYSCLNFQTCKDDGTGTCAFITNDGEEDDYQTCLDNCECSGTPNGPCPSTTADELECERGGCSNQGCFPVDEPGFTTCDLRCEYACLNFQTCKDDGTGTCAFITNEDEEDDYQTCLDNCECSGNPNGPCPSTTLAELECERGGCSNQGCFPVDEPGITPCDLRCEYSCLDFQTCQDDGTGACGFITNEGEEDDYQTCLDNCECSGNPNGPCPDPSTTSDEVECERGGCSNQGCFPADEPGITICDIRCEYSCLDFQTCKDDGTGTCAFITNEGEEDDYQTCLDNCECSGRPLGPCPSSSTTAVVEPTLPPICAVVLCESPESRCASATCDGCNADDENIECSVEDCDASPCCGCLTFRINGRNVTGECAGGQIACRCAQPSEDETYCCAGEQFTSICQRDCGTCYDVDEDCTAGPCDECPVNQLSTGDACNFSGTCYWGEESCCGQTFPSYGCSCFNGQAGCFFTDSCLVPPCTTQSP